MKAKAIVLALLLSLATLVNARTVAEIAEEVDGWYDKRIIIRTERYDYDRSIIDTTIIIKED